MGKESSARIARAENRGRLCRLLDQYGNLLTAKQLAVVSAYAKSGQSFSEVARQHGVSRQAVHESVRSAEKILTEYSEKLGHLKSPEGNKPGIDEVVLRLESLKTKIARTGIIYSVDWIRREIDSVMGMLSEENEARKANSPKAVSDEDPP